MNTHALLFAGGKLLLDTLTPSGIMHYKLLKKLSLIASLIVFFVQSLAGQQPWDNSTYPDEFGFQKRLAPMLSRIAGQGFGQRSLAPSNCPDTGLPVKVWAVEGETIVSPYTGRRYQQGPTGYFGPKSRNEKGEITAFGGDPLKYDLPPATASLLLNPKDHLAKAFLSIPGNLRQQYHFACKNWARFYPLLADEMGPVWQQTFYDHIAKYAESRRPSDGGREWAPLSNPHHLIGQAGHLLGGNSVDGGTENHKTMWRTSALVYAQLFPDTAKISGYPVAEAKAMTLKMIRDYLKRLLITGNGEYDSQIYYPHSIEPFMNLYDFSPDPEIKALAKFALDYYFLTYGLKVVDGAIAGGQKRGYIPHDKAGEMETMLWAYFNNTSRDMSGAVTTIQQTTTTYRPNKVIWNILQNKIALPFESRMSRPFYHMDRFNAFQESFYRSNSFGLGNVYMSIVDNPNQQICWSLVARGKHGPLAMSGGQPYPQGATGHSPYTQTLHSKGTLVLLTAPTLTNDKADQAFQINPSRMNPWHLPDSAQVPDYELANRQRYAAQALAAVDPPEPTAKSVAKFWKNKTRSAASWLWIPRGANEKRWIGERLFIHLDNTFVAITPLSNHHFFVDLPVEERAKLKVKSLKQSLTEYELWIVAGRQSGYIVEAVETAQYGTLEAFSEALAKKTKLDTGQLASRLSLTYQSIYGEKLDMRYNPQALKANSSINGTKLDYDNWTDGAVYESPYLKIKEGVLEVTDGEKGYRIDFRGEQPLYQVWKAGGRQ